MNRKAIGLATVVALSFAACGGGGGVDPETWAEDVCGAASDWVNAIVEGQGDLASATSPAEGREVLGEFLDNAVTETEDFIAAVDDAGVPDVDEGEERAEELGAALDKALEVLEEARDKVDDLSDDPAEFQTGAAELGASAQEALASFGEGFGDSAELEEVFQENETCTSIGT